MDEKSLDLLENPYIEVVNAKKELKSEIQVVYDEVKELHHDLNTMEIITTKNAYDIAILKAIR